MESASGLYVLDDSPQFEWIRLDVTSSVMDFVRSYNPIEPREVVLVTAEHQTLGRGRGSHLWESERGCNLLLAFCVRPRGFAARDQFMLSRAMALSVCRALEVYGEGFVVKWPNDVWHDGKKIGGILIENNICGHVVERSVIGVGVNINQEKFSSDAPNPVSLRQILGREVERVFVLADIVRFFRHYYGAVTGGDTCGVVDDYMARLYRRTGWHSYRDGSGCFRARLEDIERGGHLVLVDEGGCVRRYDFGEVVFVVDED